MTRFKDWDLRLIEYATAVKGMPFEWGNTNCAALAAGCIDAIAGTDLFQMQKNLRLDEDRARKLSAEGFTRATLLDAGLELVENHNFIQRGDIVLALDGGWECCQIVLGRYVLTSTPELGVFFARLSTLMQHAEKPEVFRCPQ